LNLPQNTKEHQSLKGIQFMKTNIILKDDTEKKTRVKSSLIKNTKWLKTKDGATTYSYMARSLSNRAVKDELTNALRKKKLDVSVLSKNLCFKATGEKISSYIIAVDSSQFSNAFPSITTKATNINFAMQASGQESDNN
jgi:hypothetical protein